MRSKEFAITATGPAFIAAVALLPTIIRGVLYEGLLIGSEPYKALNNAMQPGDAYSAILFAIGHTLGQDFQLIFIRFAPTIFMLAGTLIGYSLLRKMMGHRAAMISAILFMSTSAALSSMLRFGDGTLNLFLSSLGIWIFSKNRIWIISLVPFVIVTWSSSPFGLVTMVALLIFSAGHSIWRAFLVSAITSAIGLIGAELSPNPLPIENLIIADFGSVIGLSMFTLILAAGGLIVTWTRRVQFTKHYMFMLLGIVSFRLWPMETMLTLAASASIFGAIALDKIILMKWRLQLIKQLTIMTLACGIVFSAVVTLDNLTNSPPYPNMVQSWLSLHRMVDGKVLSHEKYGPWIKAFSDKETVLPGPTSLAYETFYSIDITKARRLFAELNVSYLWIDEDMRNGLVWSKPEEGLLFLLRNNETFKRVYNNSGIEIWEVTFSEY